MRLIVATICASILAACAGTPVPVPPPVYQPVYYPSPEFGPPGDVRNPTQGPFQPNAELFVCSGSVSNAPPFDRTSRVTNFNPIIIVDNQIVMASVPANEVCLSSGYGIRNGRAHNGSDFAPVPRGEERVIYTAAPGIVREARVARGFGNYVVVDHGFGIFTRYAHLASIDAWAVPGAEIGFGHRLGMMGESGNARGVHLHFEVLMGDINSPRGSFGLQTFDPLSFPAWAGLGNS